MLQCEGKFCSNTSIKDVAACQLSARAKSLGISTKFRCFYHNDGAGCEECGGKTVRGSGCKHCIECGWSLCG